MSQQPPITLSDPFPLLDPGEYVARCTEAKYAWARQWKKWIARLGMDPLNYDGRPFTGRLCKFLGLGKDPRKPYAGPHSHFRRLLVEVNGHQPLGANIGGLEVFVGALYDIEVLTVNTDREGKPRPSEHWYSTVRKIHPHKCTASNCSCTVNFSCSRTFQPFNSRPLNPSTQRTQTTLTTDQHSNTVNTPQARVLVGAGGAKGFEDEFG
jgi:hypothetical protein